MNFLGFGQSAEIDIVFDGAENRKTAEVKGEDGKVEQMLLFYDGETVSGRVNVSLKKPGSKLEHQGIKIEFIGQIELFYDRGNHNEFKCLAKALARPGDLIQNTSYPFEFLNVEKPYEVYAGSNVRLRYFLRATIVRRISDIIREVDIAVHTLSSYPDMNNPIKMEVGIEDCLHIEFEYNKSKYHLRDTIIGKIYFLLVRIKIKHMEIAIIKRESTGTGPNMYTENETIAKFEIMDGAPVKGESIPIRVFLAGYILTPTMRDVNKKFSVKYFLNLVLMDTEDRRYFKQQEITLWRKADLPRYLHAQQQHQQLQQQHQQHQQLQHYTHPQLQPQQQKQPYTANVDPLATETEENSGSVSVTPTHGDGKMGLFTRESPNQDYAATSSSSQIQAPTSPTLPQSPVASSPTLLTAERGMGDGAAAATAALNNNNNNNNNISSNNTTATTTATAMLSHTPPPLPTTVEDTEAGNTSPLLQQQADLEVELEQDDIEDNEADLVAVNLNKDDDDDDDDKRTTTKTTKLTTNVKQTAAVVSGKVSPLPAD